MNQLPEVLFTLLQTFLSYDDYHYLLNTSLQLFGDLKRRAIYFHLNVEWSIRYIQDKDFQRILLSKVDNGWDQIGIHVQHGIGEIPADLPIHRIVAIHKLQAEQWNKYKSIKFQPRIEQPVIPRITNVRELYFTYNGGLIDLTTFQSLSQLILYKGKDWTVEDITPLSKIPHLSIGSFVNIKDFSMFSSQTFLEIYNCQGLTDVSSFRFIRHLKLKECHSITDVSVLNGVYDLTLYYCRGIKDISRLGNHHRLELSNLDKDVRDFNCLLHIPHVSLDSCAISDLNVLRYATSVSIGSSCYGIDDVSPLKNVKKVDLSGNGGQLLGLKELGEVADLTYEFDEEQEINDILLSSLKNERLSLLHPNFQITGLSVFSTMIKHLTIVESEAFAEFVNEGQGSLFGYLTSLTLDSLSVENLEGFGDIPTVRVRSCDSLRSLDGLGRNRCVEVRYCSNVEDVSSLATVPIVTIEVCKKLTEKKYECLKKVPRFCYMRQRSSFSRIS